MTNDGSIPSIGKRFLIFSKASRSALGPTQCPAGLVRGAVFPGVRWPWPETDYSCQSSADINAWICTHPSDACLLSTVQLYFYCSEFALLPAERFAFGGKQPFTPSVSQSVCIAVSYQIWALNPDIDSVIVAWPCSYFCPPFSDRHCVRAVSWSVVWLLRVESQTTNPQGHSQMLYNQLTPSPNQVV